MYSELHHREIEEYVHDKYYHAGDIVSFNGKFYVQISREDIINHEPEFRSAWVEIPHPDKCITMKFLGQLSSIIIEYERTRVYYYDLDTNNPWFSVVEKKEHPVGDWCVH